jgi:nicotinate-nucleotide--dimethylbenzimidazole phosphoribosyltransferase
MQQGDDNVLNAIPVRGTNFPNWADLLLLLVIFFIGAAAAGKPVVIDGFISAVAALCAVRLCPAVLNYMIASHASYELGYRMAMKELGLEPMLLLGMRLGEGSGCPLAFEIVSAACAVMNDMATFDQAGINDDYLEEIRKGDKFSVEEN